MLAPVAPSWTKWVRWRILFLVVGVVKILQRTRTHPSAECPLCHHYHQQLLPSVVPATDDYCRDSFTPPVVLVVVGGHPFVVVLVSGLLVAAKKVAND